jgi:hypothetical protein
MQWDKTEYDTDRHIPMAPAQDATETVHNHRLSQHNVSNLICVYVRMYT